MGLQTLSTRKEEERDTAQKTTYIWSLQILIYTGKGAYQHTKNHENLDESV